MLGRSTILAGLVILASCSPPVDTAVIPPVSGLTDPRNAIQYWAFSSPARSRNDPASATRAPRPDVDWGRMVPLARSGERSRPARRVSVAAHYIRKIPGCGSRSKGASLLKTGLNRVRSRAVTSRTGSSADVSAFARAYTEAAVAALIAAINEPNERAAALRVLRNHGRAVQRVAMCAGTGRRWQADRQTQ
jgi:hypothetical protein